MDWLNVLGKTPPPDEYLTPEQVLHLRSILVEQATSLLDAGKQAVTDLTTVREVDPDDLDLAATESSREFSLRLVDRERRMTSKIQHALERIDEGTYGTCEVCGAAIMYRRLVARPVATQCIDCKTEAEQLERPKTRAL